MLPEKIMQSDFLDLLFEDRNKLYGAYAIRRSYNKTLAAAITVTVSIALLFCLLQLIHRSKPAGSIVSVFELPDNILEEAEPIKPQPEKPAIKPPAANHFKQVVTSTPVIVDDNQKTDMPDVDEINNSIIGNKKLAGDDVGETIETAPAETHGPEKAAEPVVEVKENNAPLVHAQVMPEFPGGKEAFLKFMLRNLKQPDDLTAGEKIIVTANFVVNKYGQIEQVKIIGMGRADLDKEVMRVINKMPLWKPGLQNGKAVAVYFNLPVTFLSTDTE